MIKTDPDKITQAAQVIAGRRLALAWLEKYGRQVAGKEDSFNLNIKFFASETQIGSQEAAIVVASCAREHIGRYIEAAIERCQDDITMALETIRLEIDR